MSAEIIKEISIWDWKVLICIIIPVIVAQLPVAKWYVQARTQILLFVHIKFLDGTLQSKFPFIFFNIPKFTFSRHYPFIKENREPFRCKTGLVALLTANIRTVENTEESPDLDAIHFVRTDRISYEKRSIEMDDTFLCTQIKIIYDYYNKLNIPPTKIFQYEEKTATGEIRTIGIVEKLKDIYSEAEIRKHFAIVKNNAKNNGALNFIGDKVGVCGYKLIKGKLTLAVYETDHFTWFVFKEIFKNENNKPFFKEIIRRLNIATYNDKKLLVQCLAFLFSSFGVDILIDGFDCSRKHKILIGVRNSKIESIPKSTLHVPVNETLTSTDFIGNTTVSYGLYECVQRGIEEEIGIDGEKIDRKYISFSDFAVVTDEGEIGFSCHVDLSEIMPIEQITLYPGQDKYLELQDIIAAPYPPLLYKAFLDINAYPDWFYEQITNEKMCLQWQSFTPLIYLRLIIRNIKISTWRNEFIKSLTLIIAYCVMYRFNLFDFSNWISKITALAVTLLTVIAVEVVKTGVNRKNKYQYSFIKPFVPQWNGDATVLQATGKHPSDKGSDFSKSLHFGINKDELDSNDTAIMLSDLSLISLPYCAVRKENRQNRAECPISFFHVSKNSNVSKKIRFIEIPYLRATDDNCAVFLTVKAKAQKIVKYYFTREIDDEINLPFTQQYTSEECNSYANYYKINKDIISNICYSALPDSFIANWQLYDLFLYNGDCYWSALSKESTRAISFDAEHKIIAQNAKQARLYDTIAQYQSKDNCELFTVKITGNKNSVVYALNKFISHIDNRRKIDDLDLYAMQLFLIREDLVFASTKERKKHVRNK
jgi:hypothetical protein